MNDVTKDPWSVLSAHQQVIAKRFIAAREAERTHLVVYLSGAHAYGFPSPDSDLDLKCVHIAPTQTLVGLDVVEDPGDRIEVIEGVELDYGSNELAHVLRGAIKGNGNYLERILGELVLGGDAALLAEARSVVRPVLSRRCAKHYGGFATSQLRLFDQKPTAKRALYVLRTAATGVHLLTRGELVIDLERLRDHLPNEVDELLTIKRTGERSELEATHAAVWRSRLTDMIDAVDGAWRTAVIPADPPPTAVAAVDAWLRDVRKRHW
ncbi:MAG: nucleotidyltransferase domain-containing protein [Myxococcales bacterium]|nr:nucleotidyltransferase domain-containing protein [Myxococcales bacterium]